MTDRTYTVRVQGTPGVRNADTDRRGALGFLSLYGCPMPSTLVAEAEQNGWAERTGWDGTLFHVDTEPDADTDTRATPHTYAGTDYAIPAGRHPFALAPWLAEPGVIASCDPDSDAADAIRAALRSAAFDYGLSLGAAAFEDDAVEADPLSGRWADSPTVGSVWAEAVRTVADDTAGATGADGAKLRHALQTFGVRLDAADDDYSGGTVAEAFEEGYAWTEAQYPDAVCVDCAMAAANGVDEFAPPVTPTPLGLTDAAGLSVVVGGTPHFRHAPWGGCPGCGSMLGGDYWPAAITER